jgi:cell division septation protein DedD
VSILPNNGSSTGRVSSPDEQEIPHLSGRRGTYDAYDQDPRDPEITLGTMTVLGIFFALAVLCAGFFGFGYSVALRRATATKVSSPAPQVAAASAPIPKPSPGNPTVPVDTSLTDAITSNAEATPPAAGTLAKPSGTRVVVPATGAAAGSPTPPPAVAPTAPAQAPPKEPAHASTRTAPPVLDAASATTTTPAILAPATQTMVQVAALTRIGDVQLVVSALKSKGYDATVHTSPQDRFLHVQVGPFSNKKDAEAMRQRILDDGFNAIVK